MTKRCKLGNRIVGHFFTKESWKTKLMADMYVLLLTILIAVFAGVVVTTSDYTVTAFHLLIVPIVHHALINCCKLKDPVPLLFVTSVLLGIQILLAYRSLNTYPSGSDLALEFAYGAFVALLSFMINFWVIHQIAYGYAPLSKEEATES